MSQINVTTIRNRTGGPPSLDKGVVVTGIATATTFKGNLEGTLPATIGTGVTVTSAGIVSATSYYGSGANLTGIDATALKDSGGNVKVQANSSGTFVTGIITATTVSYSGTVTANAFSGDGGDLTGLNIPAGFTELDAALFN